MSNHIQLKIILPHKVLPTTEIAQVVIPAYHGMLTVIKDRAPTTVLLKNGILDILDTSNASVKKYFIQGGVANIAANECVVMTGKALEMSTISETQVQEALTLHQEELKNVDSSSEKEDEDTRFYQDVMKYLKTSKA